jgi:UDPglucose 6-dehydrogenase
VSRLPDELSDTMSLTPTPLDAVRGADALVIATEWPEFAEIPPEGVLKGMRQAVVVDPNGFLQRTLGATEGIRYARVGSPS